MKDVAENMPWPQTPRRDAKQGRPDIVVVVGSRCWVVEKMVEPKPAKTAAGSPGCTPQLIGHWEGEARSGRRSLIGGALVATVVGAVRRVVVSLVVLRSLRRPTGSV